MTALVANTAGEIFELIGYAAVGMAGATQMPISQKNTRNLPYGSELMYLPVWLYKKLIRQIMFYWAYMI